ncbi:MAG: hypothetical protein WAL10_19410 [Acetobacteraceae bacterium]|jgi:hypothetical protein
MIERSEREATLEEIVVALRETRRGAARGPSFTVVGGSPSGNPASSAGVGGGAREHGASDAQNEAAGSTDISDLRDGEIERLLTENARLNERVVFLLKVLEGEQARSAELAAVRVATESDRSAIFDAVSMALEAELRPVLLVLLRLLQKERTHQPADPVPNGDPAPGAAVVPGGEAPPHDAGWIVDLDAARS